MSSWKISDLQQAVAAQASDELVIARGDRNFKLTAEELNQLGLLPANNLSDVADAPTALANIGGAPLSGGRGLGLYSGLYEEVVLVGTPAAPGYIWTQLRAAMNAATGPATYIILDSVAEGGTITPQYDFELIVLPGARLTGWIFANFFDLTGTVSANVTNYGIIETLASVGFQLEDSSSLTYTGGEFIGTVGGTFCDIQSANSIVDVQNLYVSDGSFGMVFNQNPAAGSLIRNCFCTVTTTGFAAAAPFSNAPFFHCVDDGAVSNFLNIFFDAANNSNIGI